MSCPILWAPSGTFGRAQVGGVHYTGQLFLTGNELNRVLQDRAWWPENVRVTSEQVMLDVSEPDGATVRSHKSREYVLNRKIRFVVDSDPKRLPWAPWKLRSSHRLEDDAS